MLSWISRWIWRLAVVAIILAAVVVSAGREMAPLLRENKSWLEANLTALTGTIVVMESAAATWEGLTPELDVRHIRIGDNISAEQVLMRVDLLRSARSFALVFDTLVINGASLRIPALATQNQDEIDVRAYLEFLFGSTDISINELSIQVIGPEGKLLPLRVGRAVIENAGQQHSIKGDISIVGAGAELQPATIAAKFYGDAAAVFEGRGRAHVDLGSSQHIPALMRFLSLLPLDIPAVKLEPAQSVSGVLWLDWLNNRITWKLDTSITGLGIKTYKKSWRVDFAGILAGDLIHEGNWHGQFSGYLPSAHSATINGNVIELPSFAVRYERHPDDPGLFASEVTTERMRILIPQLELEAVSRQLRSLGYRELDRLLKTLSPKGVLQRVSINLPLHEGGESAQIRAQLKDVSVATWEGAPALTSVDGYLQMNAEGGFIDLLSDDGFSMHYTSIYQKPMAYQKASGRIYWQLHSRDRSVYVGGKNLHMQDADGKLQGDFWLRIPPASSRDMSELYLDVRLTDSHTRYRDKYLPLVLPGSVQTWLKQSIKDGEISDSGFIYRGALVDAPAVASSYQYYANIGNGQLQFDRRWPRLTHAKALIKVDNGHVDVKIHSGKILDLNLRGMEVLVSTTKDHTSFITLRGAFGGPANDVLRLLRETSLHDTFGNAFDSWRFTESLSGTIDIGFGLERVSAADYQKVQIKFLRNNLYMEKINLAFEKLEGQLSYSSDKGVSAPALQAELWGKNQSIAMMPIQDGDGLPDIGIHINGIVTPANIANWSGVAALRFLEGDIAAGADLTVPLRSVKNEKAAFATALFYSDLQGVSVNLPAPFRKQTDTISPVSIAVDLYDDRQRYRIDYGESVKGVLEQSAAGTVRGEILVNSAEAFSNELPQKLEIKGQLDKVKLEEWLPVIDRYEQFTSTGPALPVSAGANNYPRWYFDIEEIRIGDSIWNQVDVDIEFRDACWNIAFENPYAVGVYRYYNDTRLPELDLDYYFIPDSAMAINNEGSSGAMVDPVDPLVNMHPQDLPALKVYARDVRYGNRKLGEWRFTTKPDDGGVVLADVFATMPGLRIVGKNEKSGARIYWQRNKDGSMQTDADGVALLGISDDPASPALISFVEAEETRLTGRVAWAGSPAMIGFEVFQGEVAIDSRKGRFLNSTPTTDAMRVINVFNFNTWTRRLKLDFSDLYKKGVSYDKVKSRVRLDRGEMTFIEPLVVESPSSRFVMEGKINSKANQIDATMVVTLPVRTNAAWIAGLAAGLPVAVGVWAVSKIFEGTIDNLSSISYTITGALDNPVIKFERLLPSANKNRESQAPASSPDQKP